MIIAGIYSFNKGKEIIERKYSHLLKEIQNVVKEVDAGKHITKKSSEKTMMGRMLYNPIASNRAFKEKFKKFDWKTVRIKCKYSDKYYVKKNRPQKMQNFAFREMDYIKDKLGVEVQFGKYAFMVYNVAAKMTIFKKMGYIDAGIEIVPVKQFAEKMSTGVSYFEQFIWDLEHRGVSNIDIPVLIYGVDV